MTIKSALCSELKLSARESGLFLSKGFVFLDGKQVDEDNTLAPGSHTIELKTSRRNEKVTITTG